MKKIINYKTGLVVTMLMAFASCNTWLDKPPLTSYEDNPDYWNNENAVRLYVNGFYSLLNGAGKTTVPTYSSNTGNGNEADLFFTTFSDDQAYLPYSLNGVDHFPQNAPPSTTTWNTPYNFIRLSQLLIARLNSATNISDAARAHYRGIGYFFLAMEYFDLVRHYGDVPYIGKYLDQNADTTMIWGPRTNRDAVMDSVLIFLNNATEMMYPKSVADADPNLGVNTLNQDVAYALKSRICLYEGSWAKYHESNNARASQYFTECKNASEALMNGGNYKLASDYGAIYHTAGLSTANGGEVLLYRKYSLTSNPVLTNSISTWANSTTGSPGLTKDAIDAFLCTDGLPIGLSPNYKGDVPNNSLGLSTSLLANRDLRLSETVDSVLSFMGGNFTNAAYCIGRRSQTGYLIIRFNPPRPYNATASFVFDAPVFWYPEVLLNEAEALTELGSFQQSDADATINLLRRRAGVASLNVNNVPDDPVRDSDVSPLLWEVRRERRVELMLTSFRYWDIRRWGKVQYLDPNVKPEIFLGAKVPSGAGVPVYNYQSGTLNGYVQFTTAIASLRVINAPQDYLDPIPTDQLELYSGRGINFPQNPGW